MPINIPAPPAPPNGPSDWNDAVHGNRFNNLERLGRWTGGSKPVPADPSGSFQPVAAGSLGGGSSPVTIYVVAHGWAPGYRAAVEQQGGNLLWWGAKANVNQVWASYWSWSPVTAPLSPPFPVSNGLLPSIAAWDPGAVILAYSWIDESATDGGYSNTDEVYQSEAYTNTNGIRLANALEQAIVPSFWDSPTGQLHIIGHSHGSKVATVATLTLQSWNRRVARLTILDAPESEGTLAINAANLLGFYLEPMKIANPSYDCAAGTFVDNYASYFGVAYSGTKNLQSIVEVALAPSQLYYGDDPGDQHSYAAAFYAGAAAGSQAQGTPLLGLAWPPPPAVYQPALNQGWPGGTTQKSQWSLQPGPSIIGTFGYDTAPLTVSKAAPFLGNVTGTPLTGLTFGAWPGYSIFTGSYWNPIDGDGYGVAFDVLWTAPMPGDYLVVSSESPEENAQEVLLVMDGVSAPRGLIPVAFNADVSSLFYPVWFYIYYLAGPGNSQGKVTVSNFRLVEVTSADGSLRRQRIARAAERRSGLDPGAPRRGAEGPAPELGDPTGAFRPHEG
jgi:hypothetical protein